MEFNIDIKTGLNGHILIEDYSREYSQYLTEGQEVQEYDCRYLYNECYTLNILTKITTSNTKVVDVSIHKHDQLVSDPTHPGNYIYDVERTKLKVKHDGFYHLHHIVIPTMEWYENVYTNLNPSYLEYFDTIYVIDGESVKKLQNSEWIDVPIKEILERNCIKTTLEQCVVDIFYTGFLQLCYINYCKQLFNNLTKQCDYKCVKQDVDQITYARDFLWMVLNIIDYQINFKQYLEAQRILELVNYCGGFCNQVDYHENVGCGCS